MYGFSDTVNDICISMRSHEGNENDQYVFRNDAIISILSLTVANSEVSRADISAVAAGSFTLNWSVQSDTTAMVFHYEVIGGTDITNVSVFNGTHQNFSTGNHSYNGTGTTFTPDFALTVCSSDANVPANTIQNGVQRNHVSIGVATSTTKQWVFCGREATATTSNTAQFLKTGSCLCALTSASDSVAYEGTFVSFNSAAGGGITINITNAAQNVTQIGFLLVKGGKWGVDVFQQRSGTGTQNVTLADSTVTPRLVQVVGINSATTGTVVPHAYLGIGSSDGTREGNTYTGNTDALATWVTSRSTDTGKLYRNGTPFATATSSITDVECDMQDMSTAGQYTLNWTTADTTQRQMAYWMVGEVAAPAAIDMTQVAAQTFANRFVTKV